MSEEKSEVLEKQVGQDRLNDRRLKLSFFYAPVPYERRKPKDKAVNNVNITDCQMATYWG